MQNKNAMVDPISGRTIDGALLTKLINHQTGDTPLLSARVRVCDITGLTPVPVVPDSVAAQVSLATSSANGGIGKGLPPDKSDVSRLLRKTDIVVTHDSTKAGHRTVKLTTSDPSLYTNPTSIGLAATPWDIWNNVLDVSQVMVWPRAGICLEAHLGHFYMAEVHRTITSGSVTYDWAGADLSSCVSDASLLSDYVVPAGYAGAAGNGPNGSTVNGYIGAIIDLLHQTGLAKGNGGTGITPTGNDDGGPGVPYSWIDIPLHGNQPVAYDILFPPGTNRIKVINQLLQAINYTPLWVDEKGHFCSRPIPDVTAAVPAWAWDYSPASGGRISGPVQQDLTAQSNTPLMNQVRVVASAAGAAGQDLSVISANKNPNSAVSMKNLRAFDGGPRAINGVIRNDKIPNLALLQAAAALALQQGSSLSNAITVSTWHNPLHQDLEYIKFNLNDRNGRNLISSDDTHVFVEAGWELTLNAKGRMKHLWKAVTQI